MIVQGMKVRARTLIVEDDIDPNPEAGPCEAKWVHAEMGDEGEVLDVEPLSNLSADDAEYDLDEALGYTVLFARTGTATLTFASEIEVVDGILN